MSKLSGLAATVDKPSRCYLYIPTVNRPPLASPDGQQAWIDVLSLDSLPAAAQRRSTALARLDKRASKISLEDLEAEQAEMLAALIVDWRLVALDGSPIDVPCSRETARELATMPTFAWVRRQLEEHIADLGNFMRATAS